MMSVVTTRDRVDSVLRNLQSQIALDSLCGHDVEYVVMDDSSSPLTREDLRRNLSSLSKEFRVSVRYAGTEEKGRFVDFLTRNGIRKDVVDFLFGVGESSLGANRNFSMLDSLGRYRVLFTDDDIFCLQQFVWHDEAGDDVVFYPTMERALDDVKMVTHDLWSIIKDSFELSRIMMFGTVGYSGMRTLGRCVDGTLSDICVRMPRKRRNSNDGFFMMGASAFNNSFGQSVPFYPRGRNSDGVFGKMISSLGSLIVYVPLSLFHSGERQSSNRGRYESDDVSVKLIPSRKFQSINELSLAIGGLFGECVMEWDKIIDVSRGTRVSEAI